MGRRRMRREMRRWGVVRAQSGGEIRTEEEERRGEDRGSERRTEREREKRSAGVPSARRESYNSTKHNPRVNLTSPCKSEEAGATRKGTCAATVEEEKDRAKKGNPVRLNGERGRGRGVDGFSGVRDEGRGGGRRIVDGAKDRKRGRKRGKRFGASPIILQSSATTHRLFLPPWLRGDVQIALMADQRGKLCPTGTYLFPRVGVSFGANPPSPWLSLSRVGRCASFDDEKRRQRSYRWNRGGQRGSCDPREISSRFEGENFVYRFPGERKLFPLREGEEREKKKKRKKNPRRGVKNEEWNFCYSRRLIRSFSS